MAVAGVTLHVDAGEYRQGLIGPNGSGKSTLLSTIAGTYQPNAGASSLTGRKSAGCSARQGFRPRPGGARTRIRRSSSACRRWTTRCSPACSVQRGQQVRLAPVAWAVQHQERQNTAEAAVDLADLKIDDRGGAGLRFLRRPTKLLEMARCHWAKPRMPLLDEPTAGVAPAWAYHPLLEEIERMRTAHGLTFLHRRTPAGVLFDFVHPCRRHGKHRQVIAEGKPAAIQ